MTGEARLPDSIEVIESDLGLFAVVGDDLAVTRVLLPHELIAPPRASPPSAVIAEAAGQISAYLDGELDSFTVPWRSSGTRFQEAVWSMLDNIALGQTETYGWVADGVGRPRGARAVGQALGRNPLPILRPCHRVVAAGGLGGYGGGARLKQALLEREGASI
jgi:methylated-DNA-[protein]-cysteine S-methyltransferase